MPHSAKLCFILLLFVSGFVLADDEANQTFVADTNIQKVAEADALDAVDYSKRQFGISLDWTDASILNVEKALGFFHSSYMTTTPRPTEEQVMSFAKAYGSYVGEVYRRNHGGQWGLANLNGQKFPGFLTKNRTSFWPWARAFNRIIQGPENNIADYYQALLKISP